MIAIVDFGAGNIFSVVNAVRYVGLEYEVTFEESVIKRASGIILPGVGAFPDAVYKLEKRGLIDLLREQAQKKPFLGICLGMQLLFSSSCEFKFTQGLSLIPGDIVPIEAKNHTVPHMGWNSLRFLNPSPLLEGINEGEYVYFVHSFRASTREQYIAAACDYSEPIPALVQRGNIFGTQFHPEKSGEVGLRIFKNFGGLVK